MKLNGNKHKKAIADALNHNKTRLTAKTNSIRERFPKKIGKRHLKDRPIAALIPNITTVLGLCFGLTSVRMALMDRYDYALIAILIAALLDAMDGRLARMLNTTSRFGAELDSFSDLICFGVSPALVMYFKTVKQLDGLGWVLVLFCSVCMALRLARFNVKDIEGTSPVWSKSFFTGVPAPAAAYLVLSPLYLHTQFQNEFFLNPFFCATIMFMVGCLMVSSLPTFALKNMQIKQKHVLPIMLVIVLMAGILLTEPYLVLSFGAIIYVGTFPFSYAAFKKLQKAQPLTTPHVES
jgi:CDP-diacylglycerol--serine O-phosphatidyltransferase